LISDTNISYLCNGRNPAQASPKAHFTCSIALDLSPAASSLYQSNHDTYLFSLIFNYELGLIIPRYNIFVKNYFDIKTILIFALIAITNAPLTI